MLKFSEKAGGIGVGIETILSCSQLAATKAADMIAFLKKSLAAARPPPPPLKVERVGEKYLKDADYMDVDRPTG